MASDFPYVYPNSRAEARRLGQTQMHEDSFRLNVDCARAIEQAIRDHFNETERCPVTAPSLSWSSSVLSG